MFVIGQTLAHYRITGAIGAGGMARVYRATDTKLGRDVALKVLPAEMAARPERLERFRREAKALAALDHPGIVTVHSVEQAGGVHFLTMQLVEGKPLDQLIPAGGLPVAQMLEIAAALAGALAAAHEKGIVHRDLKPANVMVTNEGRVKVLDFGLVKWSAADTGEFGGSDLPTDLHTSEGVVLGTVPYMSPEQIQGRAVDHRTDIFSLGVILYEMATGRRPFQSDSAAGLMSAILRDTPAPAASMRADLPEALQRVIEGCLQKDPADRVQSAREVRGALEHPSQPTADPTPMAMTSSFRGASFESGDEGSAIPAGRPDSSPERPGALRVAVLPFASAGSDPDVASFAEGLTEDILIGLSRFSYLFVVSRNSTARYKDQAIDVRKAGEELRARYVMEGRIRKAGSAIRVNVQMVDAHAGTHLWAETYDRDLAASGMFALQDEITDRVVATVADPFGVLVRSMAAESADKPPESLTPYEVVLRFFLYERRWSPEDHLVVRAALERAVTVEPGYADAWACLTLAYLDEHRHKFNPRPLCLDRALDAARRAVAADPASQLAHSALAQAHFYRRDAGSFRATAERAVALNRRSGDTLAMMGLLTSLSGDWERGLALTKEARSLNPHHPGWYHFQVSLDHYRRGEYGEALGAARKINMPDLFSNHLALAIAHGQLGHDESARRAAREMLKLYPEFEEKGQAEHLEPWLFSQPVVVEHMVDGLRKAGLDMARASKRRPAAEADRAHSRPAHTGEQDLARTTTSTQHLVEVTRKRKLGAVLALTSLLAAGAGLIFWLRPWTGQHGATPQAATARITPFTTFSGAADQPAFSPGGDQIAFTWDGGSLNNVDIYVKLIDAGTPLRLTTDPGEDVSPAWSPDGRYLAFIRRSASENGVFIVPALGGAERKLAKTEPSLSRLAWSPDGKSLAVVDRVSPQSPYGIFLLSLEDGQKQELTSPLGSSPGTPEDNSPAFSPDGKILAFIRSRALVSEDIYLTPVHGGKPQRLTADERQIHSLAWTADGSQIVFSSNRGGGFSLWRVPVSGGTPERVAVAAQNVYSPAISLRGNRLAYNVSFVDSNIWRIDRRAANRQNSPTRLIASTRQDHSPQISPDGKRIVFASDRSGNDEIWVCESDGSHPAQLTFFDSTSSGTPRWSPDSQQVVFDARPAGNSDIYVMRAEGGKPRPLTFAPSHDVIPSWSRDGRWIYFCSNRSGAMQIWKVPAGGGQAVPVTKQGGLEALESPDGKLLFYTKSRGPGGIWQVPVGGGEERPVPGLLGAGYWRYWAVLDDGICFVEPVASARPAVKFFSFATHRVIQIGVLEKDPLQGPPGLTASPDGRWVLYAQADQSISDIMLVEDFH